MAYNLRFVDKTIKNLFGDVIGGAQEWNKLLVSFSQLLEQARKHGWKFKPAKTYISWEDIEVVGAVYKDGRVSTAEKSKAAVAAIQLSRTLSEVPSILGLFNQIRDRTPCQFRR